ncbi:MAG: DUF692 family multinuclear iron-containing protein [Ferruginibacter sp.]
MAPINGFIILDLHNLYCQCHNFNIAPEDILRLYPLHRVREIHVSGGSWEDSQIDPGKKIRRDTHDDSVPAEVFRLLKHCIEVCPQVKFVVLEQLSNGLQTEDKRELFRKDFLKMDAVINEQNQLKQLSPINLFLPAHSVSPGLPAENELLHAEQSVLSDILETADSYEHAVQLLRSSILYASEWKTEKWEPYMLETALAIAQKWKHGFA